MDQNELARRMGVTLTGSSSQSDKKRMHLKDGGPAFRKYGENGAGRLKPRVEASIGGRQKPLSEIQTMHKSKAPSPYAEHNKRLFESGGISSGPNVRQKASVGGDMVSVGRNASLEGLKQNASRAKSSFVDVGRKIKNDAGRLKSRDAGRLKSRVEASIGGDMVSAGKRIAKDGAEFVGGKLKNASLEGLKQNASRAKSSIEGVGRKIKSGAEGYANKVKSALHFNEGGEVETSKPYTIRKPVKSIEKGSMGKPKDVKQGSPKGAMHKGVKSLI